MFIYIEGYSTCHEPSIGDRNNLEFKIKKEGSYSYRATERGRCTSYTKPNRDKAGQSSSFVTSPPLSEKARPKLTN